MLWSILCTRVLVTLVHCQETVTPVPVDSEDESAKSTPETSEATVYFNEAMAILNNSKPDRQLAYNHLLKSAYLGHIESIELIAEAQLFGTDMKLDLSEAASKFKKLAATHGSSKAHLYLGFMYSIGLGVQANSAKSFLYYTMAASEGELFAKMAMGYRYWSGVSALQSCEPALAYYQHVAKKVEEGISFSSGPSVQRVRLIDEVEVPGAVTGMLDDDLIQYYQFLADKGDIQAQFGLGQLHYQGGRGVEQDHARALSYFTSAAEAGNANAMSMLGKMYLEGGPIVQQDNKTAFKYFEMAAEKNNPLGQSGLGIMYLYGRGVQQDYSKAFKYFTQASAQGYVDGQLHLGLMYYKGLGVPQDYKTATKFFSLASQSGNILGYYHLASMHASGTGVLRSCNTAVDLFKNVAERGRWSRDLVKAHSLYKEGRHTESFIRYAYLAELGYEVAQSNAAFILDRGEVSSIWSRNESLIRALMYWSRAAAQGYSFARVKLGDYHYYGCGTRVDYETAAYQYRLASETQQNAQALFNLGYMHEQGLGLARDFNLAKRYYDQAAETSPDAAVPVALALMKLALVYAWDLLQTGDWTPLTSFSMTRVAFHIGPNWDLYLVTILAMILAGVLLIRRTPEQLRPAR